MFRIDPSCTLSTATIEGHPAVVMTRSLPCPYALCYSKAGWWWWCGVARHENRNYRLIRPRGISTPAKKNTQILSSGRHNKFIIVPSLADVDKRNLARTLVRMTSLQCWKQQQQMQCRKQNLPDWYVKIRWRICFLCSRVPQTHTVHLDL